MGDLFGTLTSATRALDAQRYGLELTGQNIANVNTPGYARRAVDLVALAPNGPGSAGGGVDVGGVRALRDRALDSRLQRELPAQTREAAMAEALTVVEASLGDPGSSVDVNLERFFNAFAELSESPTSAIARDNVLIQAEGLASVIRNMAGRLDSARRDADRQARGAVDEVNAILSRIAALNTTVANQSAQELSLHARDEQLQLIRKVSEQIDIQVTNRTDGGVDLSIGNGRPLIVGQVSYPIEVQSTATGYATLFVGGLDVTGEVTGGRLGGFLQVRDVNIPDYQSRLDAFAYGVATEVNSRHATGYDQTGGTGANFFEFSAPLVGTTGAAAALIVRPAVAADSRLIAAGSTTAPGDNLVARGIASLRQQAVMNANTTTLSGAWGQLVYRVGRDTKAAADERDSRLEIVRQVDALRDAVSGVSLDEEATQLLKFQRAYEANARFFQVIDRTLESLMSLANR